jgi:ribonuclease D
LERVRPRILELASELAIPQENLLSPDTLRRICFSPEGDIPAQLQALRARPWQIELVSDLITESLREPDLNPVQAETSHEEL